MTDGLEMLVSELTQIRTMHTNIRWCIMLCCILKEEGHLDKNNTPERFLRWLNERTKKAEADGWFKKGLMRPIT